jgi:hypothetical protein
VSVTHDRWTDQTRWTYDLVLENTSPDQIVHLTHLWRQTRSRIEPNADGAASTWTEEYWLDLMRADLRLEPNRPISLRCAESVFDRLGPTPVRMTTGSHEVWLSYRGEISPSNGAVRFEPVVLDVRATFELLEPVNAQTYADGGLQWTWISDECVTCRPSVYCQKLPPRRQEFDVNHHVSVHIVGGFAQSMRLRHQEAERLSIVMCTEWSAVHPVKPVTPFWRCSHRTEMGLSRSSPFLVLQSSESVARLGFSHSGTWAVRICTFTTEDLADVYSSDNPTFDGDPGLCLKESITFSVS